MATKDFATFAKKKNIIYTVFIVPFVIAAALPVVIWYTEHNANGSVSPLELTVLLPALTFFFLVIAGLTPTTIASYSLVGEKLEKSIEPLLATPTTDGEILLGKGVAAFLPPIGAILGASVLYMVLMDYVSRGMLGYYYFPNWNEAALLFVLVPLAVVMSVEWNVFVSSRVSDVRIAQQIGMLMILPLGGVYISGELGLIPLGDLSTSLEIAGILAVIDLLLLSVVRSTFQRDLILTKWK